MRRFYRTRLIWSLLTAIAGFSLLVVRGVHEANPKSESWIAAPRTLTFAVALLATVTLVDGIARAIVIHVHRRAVIRFQDLEKAIRLALAQIQGHTGIPISDLGASVYVVKRRGLFWRDKHLHRVLRWRMANTPQPSKVVFGPGKGLIGACWESKSEQYVDWSVVAERWEGRQITEAEWSEIPDADKAGFSREEFIEMVSKYAEILAAPLRKSSGEFIGCVAIDRAWRSGDVARGRFLGTPPVKDLALSISNVLQK